MNRHLTTPSSRSIASDLPWLAPEDPEFSDTQPWNTSIPSQPRAVVRARSAEDVAAAVRYAEANGLRVAVRATGHGAVPVDSSVLLLHTGSMTDCTVHFSGRWVSFGAGVRWSQIIDAAQPHGLAPVCGSAPQVGAVGLLTGGGIGPISRTFGVCSDQVRALQVVTGTGRILRVSPTEHEDLFWGLRGGKATLGIVTSVELDLVPLTTFYGGSLWFDTDDVRTVLPAWRRLGRDLPESGNTSAAFVRLPPLPGVPPPLAGRQTLAIRFAWVGDPATGARYLQDLRRAAPAVLDDVRVRPYSEIGLVHNDPVDPMSVMHRSALLGELPEVALEAFADFATGPGMPLSLVELRLLGGAIAGEPRYPSAFCHRDADFSLFVSGLTTPDRAAAEDAVEQILTALAPWTQSGLLANFAESDDPGQISRYYDRDSAHWLATLGDQYDPERVLQSGQVLRSLPPVGPR